ncbi:MAG: hypothetical protein WGN25_08350 [Candidatus Electrothrix sp. GW3-4]|uniref:hypothetical protein n=1 Tax=Candidatus Electrothrix sp. GW3-4 TaxID=3126740 RepID=UPI0030D0318A
MKSTKKKALVLILVSLLLFACDRKEKEEAQPKQKPEPPKPVSMLDVVPADTIFFSGGLEPTPLQEILQWSADNFNVLQELDPDSLLPIDQDEKRPGRRMAAQLWYDYYAMMLSPGTELAKWGVEEKPFLTSYAVGLAPVLLRISLKDVQLFKKKIDELEAKAKISSKPETLGKATYRRYVLNEKGPAVDLIIGVDNTRKHGVFMLDIGVDSEQTLAIALGQQKPQKTLAESGRVEGLVKQYDLHSSWVGYLDHQQLITGLTTKDGNSIAKMMQKLAPQLQGSAALLEELQIEGCRNDLVSIGKDWPQTVFGYTALQLAATPSRLDSLLVVENKDKALLDGLQSLRGVIPQYVAGHSAEAPVVAAGIGLNFEKIAPFITERRTAIAQKQYSCSFLKEMQEDAKSQQPAALAMMTGMAPGVQGLAFSLMSLAVEAPEAGGPPMPKSIDALISLTAKNPTNLVQMFGTFFPPLAQLQLPADGTPVPLSLPVPLAFPVMAAINGSHLTVYAGEKSQALAQELRSEDVEESRGILATDIDYGKYYGLIGDALTSLNLPDAQQSETKALFEAMKDVKMRLRMNMDITGRGIEMKIGMAATE